MSFNQPLISIIAINYNSLEVTCEFIESINKHNTYPNIEILIVDNASRIDPTQRLKQIRPDINVIVNDQNLGFSGGNNVGIRQSRGDFIFIVNNDTEFTAGLLEGLLEIFELYPDAGATSPKFHYFFEKGIIEYAGCEAVNIFTGRNGMVGFREPDNGQYDKVKVTNYTHGGGMMIPGKVISKVGLMYEPYFLYYEEFDWCEQIKRNGYKIYYQPKSLIYHKESMSTGKASPLKTYYLTRNRILFMRRNVQFHELTIFLIYFILLTIPKNTLYFLFKRQTSHLRSFWKGILWHLNSRITYS